MYLYIYLFFLVSTNYNLFLISILALQKEVLPQRRENLITSFTYIFYFVLKSNI
jgi:hypothetical protein